MSRKRSPPAQAGLSIRVDLASGLQIGPGKVALLEAIAETGSISAAGRALGMSYKRAWDLVEALNRGCGEKVVIATPGGRDGGGTSLSPAGDAVIRLYREIEQASLDASRSRIRALNRLSPAAAAAD
ncbi:winged helix-turn-helix domain-containing protein [Roseomonas sp. NAR14]|uniref:Winged helix-turn-helix domain-containing protein n=1 Tax=Roseomonas acroporae TaxID=2937791 RepID=A0A9X2BZJ8_9PROT|nr:winged helix-turn-helix domain-containing protein [Roseomonas acroporae]MCK8787110.1 winged helix-turn-helix domain-containing protein [Roseomonas acroporae]